MSEQITRQFIEALERLEAEGDLETISGLFAEDAEISNVVSPKTFRGTEGAREFWDNYRKTLGEVRSIFRNQITADNTSALEWRTRGSDNNPVDYEGVSILETNGEKITRFFAYFDPAKLGSEIAEGE